MTRYAVIFGALGWLAASASGCGAADGGAARTPSPAAPTPSVIAPGSTTTEAVGASAVPPVSGRTVYDLVAHPERAERLEGTRPMIDLGAPGGEKYTFGGWQSGLRAATHADATAAITRETRAALSLPLAPLTMRVATFAPGELLLEHGREVLARAPVRGDGTFETVALVPPSERCTGRETTLNLRVGRTGRSAAGDRLGLAIDWIRVGSTSAPAPTEQRADGPQEVAAAGAVRPALRIEAGGALGFTMPVPEGAALAVRCEGGLELAAELDDGSTVQLGAAQSSREPRWFELAAVGGRVARVTMRATRATLVHEARVVANSAPPPTRLTTRPKNVVLYLIDTLRADALSPWSSDTRVFTPNLNALAEGAAVARWARTHENWTKPSVASLFTSLYPWEHTATDGDSVLPNSVVTLAETLSARGFRTGALIANGYVSDKFGFRQGFDTYRNYIRENLRSTAESVVTDAIAWLDARPRDEPFLLYVHAIDPHVPYRPPARYVEMYDAAPYSGPIDFRRDATLLENVKLGRVALRARDRERLRALYDGEITYHDAQLGRFLEALAREGLDDETIVVLTADHGEEFWDHGSVGHGHSVYDELLHIPMLMRIPGVDSRRLDIDGPVGLVDVMPTLLDALAVEPAAPLSGRSLLPAMLGEDGDRPSVTVSGFFDTWRAVGGGGFKLVQRGTEPGALYDLERDPRETRDVRDQHPVTYRWLRGELGLLMAGTTAATEPSSAAARGRRRPPRHEATRTDVDAETAAQLRALGYVGTSAP